MVEISDEFMDARLERVRSYCLMFLKVGPNYLPPEQRPSEMSKVIREHGRRNMQLRVEGKMTLVAPVGGVRPVVGIVVFAVPEPEAKEIMRLDPAVKAGIFELQWGTWYGSPGDALIEPVRLPP